jgi:hypothetical protein
VYIHKLLLPSPCSHWSGTGPRSKTQPTTTKHTQPKHTRYGCWQPQPVRPISETGQTASVGLSLTQAGETGQTGLANRSHRFFPKAPPKHLKSLPSLNRRSHSTTETLLLKNSSWQPIGLNRSDWFGKPVRPVFAWTVGKNTAHGKNSKLQPIDLLIHSTEQSETLGIIGVPRGLPFPRSSVPKTHSIKRNRKSTLKNTFPWKPPKSP